MDAGEWTQKVKDCTSGDTTTGALGSKETANFLNSVFEYERAKTATKDVVFGCDHNEERGVRVRT